MRLRGFSGARKLVMGLALLVLLGSVVMVLLSCFNVIPSGLGNVYRVLSSERNGLYIRLLPPSRKLLRYKREEPERMWGERCTKADIVINQGPTAPLPNGIPIYTVEIMNVCSTGCDISRIHLSCGWFTSANLISPKIFKRIRYNDCLVNAGKPLVNGDTISFQYANTFLYPLSVSSVVCH